MAEEEEYYLFIDTADTVAAVGFFVLFEAVDPEALVVTTIIRSREKNRGK